MTPPVTCLKTRELIFRNRNRQVVAGFGTELQELIGHLYTDCVHPPVISAGVAKTITEKTCKGVSPEWHLDKAWFRWVSRFFPGRFHYHFGSEFGEQSVVLGAPFDGSGFAAFAAQD